jgi:alpha-tubulin suppressor-like RCC1 family protein
MISKNQGNTVVIADSKLYCFGNNKNGKLGLGHMNNTTVPVLNPYIKNPSKVVCNKHCTYILSEGRIYWFGIKTRTSKNYELKPVLINNFIDVIDIIGNYNMQYSNRETNNLIIIGKNI